MQGELFYGVKQIVPAFSFRDRETGKAVWMIDAEQAARVQQRLVRQGSGLLDGGSSYSNIFTGGAAEAHFCASVMGWGDLNAQRQALGDSAVYAGAHRALAAGISAVPLGGGDWAGRFDLGHPPRAARAAGIPYDHCRVWRWGCCCAT